MKELEAQIAGLDFDIGQEKQRNYTYLSPESVEKYLNSIICGDIQEMPVRKLIVKAFMREVILDNDNVTITYNFTENYTKYRVTQEIIQKVQRQSRKKTAFNKNLCSYKLPPLPPHQGSLPIYKQKRREKTSRLFLFYFLATASFYSPRDTEIVTLVYRANK